MSRIKTVAALAMAATLLAGCKTSVLAEINLSDLLSSPTKQVPGSLYVEVPSCHNHEDSRQISTSVLEAREAMRGVFSDAKYIECFSKGFESFARFSMPIYLDKDMDGKSASDSHINLTSNEKGLLSVNVPNPVRARITNAQKRLQVGSLDMQFSIKIKNDIGKDYHFTVMSAYVDQAPNIFETLTSKPGGSFVITLSDVSARSAMQYGMARVLLHEGR